jgi:hypothetical protein
MQLLPIAFSLCQDQYMGRWEVQKSMTLSGPVVVGRDQRLHAVSC